MGKAGVDDFDDVSFEKSPHKGFTIRAATFPYLVRRSLHDFGEFQNLLKKKVNE